MHVVKVLVSLCVLSCALLACSENPLERDDAQDPEAFLFGDSEEAPATCDDVCDRLAFCVDYDRAQCADECPGLSPEERQGVVDASCEAIEAELG